MDSQVILLTGSPPFLIFKELFNHQRVTVSVWHCKYTDNFWNFKINFENFSIFLHFNELCHLRNVSVSVWCCKCTVFIWNKKVFLQKFSKNLTKVTKRTKIGGGERSRTAVYKAQTKLSTCLSRLYFQNSGDRANRLFIVNPSLDTTLFKPSPPLNRITKKIYPETFAFLSLRETWAIVPIGNY